ncbi:MAG: transcriptional regulator, partial [Oscillibacter sp.]|nr:transcriptional regulator [Oscillibacter sp.]
VTADYFLGLTETKRHPNADLADLRLSDAMIDVLEEGRVDTALLGSW